MDKESVLKILSKIKYPPYEKDIVSFGLVKEVRINGNSVELGLFGVKEEKFDALASEISTALKNIFTGIEVGVNALSSDPAKANASEPQNETLKNVKIKIAVASGKGGVGKSTVAANLAKAFAKIFPPQDDDAKVGLMDCDIHGPSAGILLGKTEHPTSDGEKIFPPQKNGVKAISMGMLVDPSQPLIWRGPMINSAIKQFANDVSWGGLELMILDLPPGTGDAVISVLQTIPLNGALIVTTANKLAETTATRGAKIFEKMNVKVLGVVENMSYMPMPDGSQARIFGEGGGAACALALGVDMCVPIPIDPSLQTENPSEASEKIFDALAKELLKRV